MYVEGDFIILLLLLIVWNDTKWIGLLKNTLSKSFAMKDFGEDEDFHDRSNEKFWLSQKAYI